MLWLSKLAAMTGEERARALRSLTAVPNGASVESQICDLEKRYEMTSATMLERVQRGELDTADTARWIVLLNARGR
jgi:hypothetical protein